MKVKQEEPNLIENIGETTGYIKAYVEQLINYYRLRGIERVANAGSSMISGMVFFMLALLMIGFGGITLAIFLGDLLSSYALGFLIVTGLFGFSLLIVRIFRHFFITNPIIAFIIDALNDKE